MKRPEPVQRDVAQYLTFRIATEEYGLALLEAREIVPCPELTRVPSLPPAVRGVVNVRGTVLAVIDPSVMFGQPERPLTGWSCIVIVEVPNAPGDAGVVGVLVDSVAQVIELEPGDIAPPPTVGPRIRAAYVLGTGKAGDRLVLLLDVARIVERVDLDPLTLLEAAS